MRGGKIFLPLLASWPANILANINVMNCSSKHCEFESRPAEFGRRFTDGIQYPARLQMIDFDPHLCGGVGIEDWDDSQLDEDEDHAYLASTSVIVPTDHKMVAVLAKRGECDFETKARTAMQLLPKGVVRYVIMYDDKPEDELPTITAVNANGIYLGLLFVSLPSGFNLRQMLLNQSEENRQNGGLEISLNSEAPPLPSIFDDSHDLIFGILTGFMFSLLLCGCLCSCIQSGFIRREGNIILLGRPELGHSEIPLLTREEVMALPEVNYEGPPIVEASQETSRLKEGSLHSSNSKDNSFEKHCPTLTVKGEDANKMQEALLSNKDEKDNATVKLRGSLFENCSCCVCLEDFQEGERLRLLPCNHSFHTECILPWLTERNPTCPLCKGEVLAKGEDSDSFESTDDDIERVEYSSEESDQESDDHQLSEGNDVPWYSTARSWIGVSSGRGFNSLREPLLDLQQPA
mmetsp:Transcript_32276/g.47485  ORF Transcript_32276/g.47485 Transcript_32276/m.47485 type:complete len:463 (-) Transcript_32276:248-1636(-)|eukprot:CAMPEP_0195521932 /NCGR_PEP_ID=MMETSP0794_2-20130614/19706_1 /TAXON_ID=515487 /ORGANISM="Stephanopyxis turris, Strain CCMP 815" /LENGTH=462 /DNA_ID=CAMNT_0040651589 /DNA_START=58 /DNA_END=1446 /DNA_ORIENTATION=+